MATPWPTSAGFRGGSVLVGDSSYFVALTDRKDRWHRDALRVKRGLSGKFLVSDFVVDEAVTLIGSRRGGQPAQVLYEYFSDECEVEFVDEDLLAEAMRYHLRFDGQLSVTDSVILALMERSGIGELVSFDDDFDRVKGITRIC